ncbi:hypothetical protein Goarm_022514, partial [Gossypium armourianum]|nr:hypothetical protein [Gossypium armourianum]
GEAVQPWSLVDDIEVLPDDVTINRERKYLEIRFSSRVHDLIDKFGRVQLVDLENDYYIVKFSIISDYKKALIDGPWTIYERYLIVQPWSRDFSTDKSYPFQVLAWVRFPGLPYRYYTKGIFRTLASEVGQIVKIDYNTIGGRKGKFTRMAIFVYLNKPLVLCIDIDGFTQKIEYEGLLQICYDSGSMVMASSNKASEDKEGLYGPWMVANTRQMRFLTTQFLVVLEI